MICRRTILFALALTVLGELPARAQAIGDVPPQCVPFLTLREEAMKRNQALSDAIKRKASPVEGCKLIKAFADTQGKMLKFMQEQGAACGMPPQVLGNFKAGYQETLKARTNICAAAAAPQGPAKPTFGEALGVTRVPDASNTSTGRGGTFNTLTGNPIAR